MVTQLNFSYYTQWKLLVKLTTIRQYLWDYYYWTDFGLAKFLPAPYLILVPSYYDYEKLVIITIKGESL